MQSKRALLTAAMATTLLAGTISVAQAGPAVVIHPGTGFCSLADGNGGFVTTNDAKVIATENKNGNITLQCKTDVTPSSTGHAIHYDSASTGQQCFIDDPIRGLVFTDKWEERVSASGNAILTCHYPD